MTLLKSWLEMLVRRYLGRQIRQLHVPAQPRQKTLETDQRQEDVTYERDMTNSRNLFFTGNTDLRTKLSLESERHKRANFVARTKAREEHYALLDSIQAQLSSSHSTAENVVLEDQNATDLLAMQSMFWHNDQATKPHREAAIRHAVRSIAQHDRIAADSSAMCLYCDGARFAWGAGAAVVIPKLRYSVLKRVTHIDASCPNYDKLYMENVNSTATELYGMVLALEAAARFANKGQRVAIFCDSQVTVELSRKVWAESNGLGPDPLKRTVVATKRLRRRGVNVRMYWLAKNHVVPGAYLAHICARRAAHREPGEEVEMSEQTWQQQLAQEAGEDARRDVHVRE